MLFSKKSSTIGLFQNAGFLLFFFSLSVISFSGVLISQTQPKDPIQKKDSEELLERAQQHIIAKRYRVAEKLLEIVKHKDPENATAYSLSGDIHLTLRELDEAETDYRLALELSARKDREYFRLGQLFYIKENADESSSFFLKALNQNPGMYITRFYMGMIELTLRRNKEKTIDHWEAYRRLQPDDPQGPEIDRAIALLKRKDFKLPPIEEKIDPQKLFIIQQGAGNNSGSGKNSGADSKPVSGENGSLPVLVMPETGKTFAPDLKGGPEKEKTQNQGQSIIELDGL